MLKGVGKISHRNPKQNSREFLQRVRLENKNTSVFLYSSQEITKAIFVISISNLSIPFFNFFQPNLVVFLKNQFSGPVVFSIKRPHPITIKFNSGHSFKRLHPKRYNLLFFNLMQQL
jgi:hypothetical protein